MADLPESGMENLKLSLGQQVVLSSFTFSLISEIGPGSAGNHGAAKGDPKPADVGGSGYRQRIPGHFPCNQDLCGRKGRGILQSAERFRKESGRDEFLQAALEEARKGLAEGGIPIGSVLVLDGRIVGRGHNRRVQKGSTVLHAEMDCLENVGRLKTVDYRRCVLYSALSPCDM